MKLSSGELWQEIDNQEAKQSEEDNMENMVWTLLNDALVQPSHVILHSRLRFCKGHLLYMHRGQQKSVHIQVIDWQR
jgi:hypothetical protein